MEFSASFDGRAFFITILTLIAFTALLLWHVIVWRKTKGNAMFWFRWLVIIFLSAAIGYGFVSYPRKFVMRHDRLLIIRPWNTIEIPSQQILDCRRVAVGEMNGSARLFGIGGLFGYCGKYHNNTIGDMQLYATRFSNFVLLHTLKGEAIILTPDKPEGMVDEIESDITINN